MPSVRPLSAPGALSRALPFVAVFLCAFAAGVLPAAESRESAFVAAALVAAGLLAIGATVPWKRLPAWTEACVPLAFAIVVVLLQESRGGAASGYAPLAILPVVWFGLYGTRQQVGLAVAAVAVEFSAPILALDYPTEEWRRAVMWAVTAPFVGLVIHSLTSRQARQSDELIVAQERLSHEHRSLEEQRDFLDAIVETADALVIVLDDAGAIVRFNHACELLTGYGAAEVLGLPFYDRLLPSDQRADVRDTFARLASGDFPNRYENEWVTRTGERRLIAWSNTALLGQDGRVEFVIGTGIEITEKRRMERELEESERRHRTVLDAAGDVVFECDAAGRWTFVSSAWESVTGHPLAESLGRPAHTFLHPADVAVSLHELARLATGELEALELEHRFLAGDGASRWVSVRVRGVRDGDGVLRGYSGTLRDVTARHAAAAALRAAQDRFETLFDRAPIGMLVVGPDGRFERVNDALCDMTGFSALELRAMEPFAIVDPRDLEDVQHRFGFLSPEMPHVALQHRCRHASGKTIWVQAHAALILDAGGQPLHVLTQVQDITDCRQQETHLRRLADHDSLTGRLNRRGFERALDEHLASMAPAGPRGALLLLDLDGFKQVNDTLGHAAGDELLVACSPALAGRLRGADALARFGGDEFAVLLPEQSAEEAVTVAQALVEVVREKATVAPDRNVVPVTVSVGVALFDAATLTREAIFARADSAMYDAKAAGRDRYAIRNPASGESVAPAGDLHQVGHHHVPAPQGEVVGVRQLLDAPYLLGLLGEELVELEEAEVHDP